MEELSTALKVVLANTYAMYFKAHGFHWNLEGAKFPAYHKFFEDIYSEVYGAVDGIAERIRVTDGYAPANMKSLSEMTTIVEGDITGTAVKDMLESLQTANDSVIESLVEAHTLAGKNKSFGLINFLEDRLDKHEKHGWMIKASLRGAMV
jgi:starvation-inducible DNA-binding protein